MILQEINNNWYLRQKQKDKSGKWYYQKFEEYNLPRQFAAKSAASIESHAERKVSDIVSDLEEMAEAPILEVDESYSLRLLSFINKAF